MPNGVSPLAEELYPEGAMKGFAETFARWGALLDTLAWGMVNGYPYHQPVPFDLPGPDGPMSEEEIGAEIGRRTGVAAAAFENKIWRDAMRTWDEELKPASIARHRELAEVDLAALDQEGLLAHIEVCMENLRAMAHQHHRFNGSAIVPAADFVLHAAEWTGEPPIGLYGVFDGHSPVSGMLGPEIEPALAALRADESAVDLLRGGGDPAATLATLREQVPEIDEYVRAVGFRPVEGFDITSPTMIERPEVILGQLDAGLDVDASVATQRADEFAAELRERVPDEHRAMFDELLAEARSVHRLRDERGLYSDISAYGVLRLALLEAGRRLAATGRLQAVDHILEVQSADIRALLSGAAEPSADDVAARAERRAAIVAHGAPPFLGPPPPEPPPLDQLPPPLARVMAAVGFGIDGALGDLGEPAGDETTVLGLATGTGIYEGPVHLVSSMDDLFAMEPGSVIVTRATGEAFNSMLHLVGAIVTDHGGAICHAAIVARECGFPAVVGCVDATSRLRQGQRVRVDGRQGEVAIL